MAGIVGTITNLSDFLSKTQVCLSVKPNDPQQQIICLEADRKYSIPAFQREVRWDDNNLKMLLYDLSRSSKFLGNIILTIKSDHTCEIIDGQQRTTVLMLIVSCIKKKFGTKISTPDLCPLRNEGFTGFQTLLEKAFDQEAITSDDWNAILKSDDYHQLPRIQKLWNTISSSELLADRHKAQGLFDNLCKSEFNIIASYSNDGNAVTAKSSFGEKFYQNFIQDNRYAYMLKGLGNTLIITIFAVMIGIVLGFLIAIVRTSHDRNGGLGILNAVCKAYLTIIRGTPVMIQLLIIYYVIFQSINTGKIVVAVIAFGLNSAAYVAEIVRSGIMAVDIGQFEAGRSLGLNYRQTMTTIILPQAVKNILPALCNEFISLLKETSISGYIGLMDLTKGGDIIRSVTYEAFMPLIAVAVIYLLMVVGLSKAVGVLERKLRNNER